MQVPLEQDRTKQKSTTVGGRNSSLSHEDCEFLVLFCLVLRILACVIVAVGNNGVTQVVFSSMKPTKAAASDNRFMMGHHPLFVYMPPLPQFLIPLQGLEKKGGTV